MSAALKRLSYDLNTSQYYGCGTYHGLFFMNGGRGWGCGYHVHGGPEDSQKFLQGDGDGGDILDVQISALVIAE